MLIVTRQVRPDEQVEVFTSPPLKETAILIPETYCTRISCDIGVDKFPEWNLLMHQLGEGTIYVVNEVITASLWVTDYRVGGNTGVYAIQKGGILRKRFQVFHNSSSARQSVGSEQDVIFLTFRKYTTVRVRPPMGKLAAKLGWV
jgi:hypothetical protein